MGLDLYHYKASMVPGDPEDTCFMEEFPPEAFSEYGFERFLQPMPYERPVYSATFYEDERPFQEAMARSGDAGSGERSKWFGTPEAHAEELRSIERRLRLDPSTAFRHRTRVESAGRAWYETWISYWEPTLVRGIYAVEAGYQCRGMNDDFDERFSRRGYEIYVREEDFMSLEGFLWPEYRDLLLPNLRANFIDNFERGKSFLYVSS